jgi:sporulation protein YlmC with PRC-barrel domain
MLKARQLSRKCEGFPQERAVEIKAGVQVIDKNGKVLGSVSHLARDGWSGEVKKFIVNRKPPDKDLFFTPEDILEATDTTIKLKTALDESSRNT